MLCDAVKKRIPSKFRASDYRSQILLLKSFNLAVWLFQCLLFGVWRLGLRPKEIWEQRMMFMVFYFWFRLYGRTSKTTGQAWAGLGRNDVYKEIDPMAAQNVENDTKYSHEFPASKGCSLPNRLGNQSLPFFCLSGILWNRVVLRWREGSWRVDFKA